MTNTGLGLNKYSFPPAQLFVLSVLYFVPTLSPSLFGWLNGVLAVPAFYLLSINGLKSGTTQLSLGLLIAGIGALLVQRIEVFLFSLTLLPLGYSLFKSVSMQESAAVSAGKGVAVLSLTWLVFWGMYGAVMGINPYRYLLEVLDLGFQQTLAFYASKEAGLSPEMVYNLQQVTNGMRETMPKLLPGLLASAVVLTVWINMTIGNSLVSRFCNGVAPWGRYATWKLPEQLVWVPIVATTVMLVGPGDFQHVSGWLLLISVLLYFFQGLAVFITLLERWNVPVFVRVMLYFILIIQSYGMILLAFLGISDVWFDFRQKAAQR